MTVYATVEVGVREDPEPEVQVSRDLTVVFAGRAARGESTNPWSAEDVFVAVVRKDPAGNKMEHPVWAISAKGESAAFVYPAPAPSSVHLRHSSRRFSDPGLV